MKPKVTIGVCVKNGAATLREAIESIISQTYPHELMEVIFVDDGSEDETPLIINAYASRMDINVKIFRHKWNGLGFSRNVVVKNASGKYVIWVDHDMILPKDHVQKQVDFMEKNPSVGIGKAKYGLLRGEKLVAFLENIPFVVFDFRNVSLNSKLPGTGGAIFRVRAIRKVGGFDERLVGTGEDQDLAYRIIVAGWRVERSPAYFFEKRVSTWKGLWHKYLWYGSGDYQLYRKNRSIFSLFRMTPLAGYIAGMLLIPYALKLTGRKSAFLLSFHYAFKWAAWCFGFAKAQFKAVRRRLFAD